MQQTGADTFIREQPTVTDEIMRNNCEFMFDCGYWRLQSTEAQLGEPIGSRAKLQYQRDSEAMFKCF